MKIHNLLVALTVGAFTAATMLPWMVVAQGATESVDDSGVLTLAGAQQAAAKITVRVRVGQGGGSGVLLAKKGSTYLVLTNAHVVQGQGGVTVLTPDGQVQVARRVQDAQVGDFDLALLEFNSGRSYDLAGFANFENRKAVLNEGREVFTAGFPYDANGLKLLGGRVTQLPQEAFKNGTQVGYVTDGDLIQGMSGGPILDSNGSLVGINSTLARPVIDSYVYADGSKAPGDKVAEYRLANWGVPIYNLLTRLNRNILYSYKQLPKLPQTVTLTGYMAELDRKARSVTVRIKHATGNGSGVIVAREGNTYYVLTADHVVNNKRGLKITMHDQRTYQVNPGDVQRAVGTDLAIVKFTSAQTYPVATLGSYSPLQRARVFLGGWPAPENISSQQWQWQLNPGIIGTPDLGVFETQNKVSFSNGYDLIYSSVTYGGMSGGLVFDTAGHVIGIHGKAEGDEIGSKTILGNSLGISIKAFLGLAERWGISSRSLMVKTQAPIALKPEQEESVNLVASNIATPINDNVVEQWIEYGNTLHRLGKYQNAVGAFDKAIILKPDSVFAYYGRGLALNANGNPLMALRSFDRAILLILPGKKSKFYYLFKYRSLSLRELNRFEEALVAISETIQLEPQDIVLQNEKAVILSELKRYPEALIIFDKIIQQEPNAWAYSSRGIIKSNLGDTKGAISDQDKAISINSQFAIAYYNRGVIKYSLGDKKSALFDFGKAISINSQFAIAYYNRGVARSDSGDEKGAISDYGKAISINPQDTAAYYNRGTAKYVLGDKKGAISDYDKAISISPQFALAYFNRGVAKSDLGDKKDAIEDLKIASQLFKSQNNQELYKKTIDLLQQLSTP